MRRYLDIMTFFAVLIILAVAALIAWSVENAPSSRRARRAGAQGGNGPQPMRTLTNESYAAEPLATESLAPESHPGGTLAAQQLAMGNARPRDTGRAQLS